MKEDEACQQTLQLKAFLWGYPFQAIAECMESVPCVLEHPCEA